MQLATDPDPPHDESGVSGTLMLHPSDITNPPSTHRMLSFLVFLLSSILEVVGARRVQAISSALTAHIF